jgi:hypothetical protein
MISETDRCHYAESWAKAVADSLYELFYEALASTHEELELNVLNKPDGRAMRVQVLVDIGYTDKSVKRAKAR